MSESMHAPSERLARSREQIRLCLQPPSANATGTQNGAAKIPWIDTLKANPGARVVFEAINHWWDKHPLRTIASVAGVAATASLKPVAQRHPWSLVVGAAALGSLIVWCRPWRWSRPALLAGLLPQLLLAAVKASRSQPHSAPPSRRL